MLDLCSDRQERLATRWCPSGCPRLQPLVREDPLDNRMLQDRRNDLQLASQFGQCSRSRSNTRLSSLAQLMRCGPGPDSLDIALGGGGGWFLVRR